ncbi:class II glutamine amidotransferase [Alysiella crassa]|uniref:Predicted glutamine amidotransferase n=1 Tax=Alysiella crassa TaxID=153491 RepID=A0A376BUH3_9NEIS|nr:class II glutamine amidotransferase [Alysiella crassa]UOP06045.1 class II glutamine amidotransferase [Alysiella crassa]SSY80501.1 Predicted glutamine amidotransferase [Alysiella crassa]
MCQLLGMNCNTPTDIVFSFEGFSKRGGLTDHHTDGFGIGFFENKGLRLFLDNHPSAQSPVAELVKNYPIKSENVIAHIRKASQGHTSLENTHPFQRELWGEYWLFAHNGHLQNFQPNFKYYQSVGNTDSERALCYLLDSLRQQFAHKPDPATLYAAVQAIVLEIREFGLFNMMLSNGDYLFTHTSTLLHYIVRQAPFGEAHLVDEDIAIDFNEVTTPNDRVAVIATLPLTDNETWQQLAQNEFAVFHHGEIVYRHTPQPAVYLSVEEGLAIARAVGTAC